LSAAIKFANLVHISKAHVLVDLSHPSFPNFVQLRPHYGGDFWIRDSSVDDGDFFYVLNHIRNVCFPQRIEFRSQNEKLQNVASGPWTDGLTTIVILTTLLQSDNSSIVRRCFPF
jgi:hypothetical protein